MSESSTELDTQGATAESPTAHENGQQSLTDFLDEQFAKEAPAEGDEAASGESPTSDGKAEEPSEEDAAKKAEDEEGEDAESRDEGEEDDESLPFHKHPRWQQMRAKLAEAEEKATAHAAELEDHRKLRAFTEEHDLSNEDVDRLLQAGAAIRQGDSAKVLEILEPYYRQARELAGKELPEDLASEVESGVTSPERAAEIATLRAQQKVAQELDARRQARGERSTQDAIKEAAGALNARETELLAKDPDYSALQRDVHTYFGQWLSGQKTAPTKAEALAAFDRIVAERRDFIAKIGGRDRKGTSPRPDASSRAPKAPVKPKDDSLLAHLEAGIESGQV